MLFVEEFSTWNYIASNEDVLSSYATAFPDFYADAFGGVNSGDSWVGIPAGEFATPADVEEWLA